VSLGALVAFYLLGGLALVQVMKVRTHASAV